jgi:hypothetical protein
MFLCAFATSFDEKPFFSLTMIAGVYCSWSLTLGYFLFTMVVLIFVVFSTNISCLYE